MRDRGMSDISMWSNKDAQFLCCSYSRENALHFTPCSSWARQIVRWSTPYHHWSALLNSQRNLWTRCRWAHANEIISRLTYSASSPLVRSCAFLPCVYFNIPLVDQHAHSAPSMSVPTNSPICSCSLCLHFFSQINEGRHARNERWLWEETNAH